MPTLLACTALLTTDALGATAADSTATQAAEPRGATPQTREEGTGGDKLAPPAADAQRAWYLPDQLELQFAGEIGFLSPGVGYNWLEDRLEADALFGWVPAAVGGIDVYAATLKVTYLPFALGEHPRIEPLTVGIFGTYAFGDQFFLYPPSQYPEHYWRFQTALRFGGFFGAAASLPVGRMRVRLYGELMMHDLDFLRWTSDTESVSLVDVFAAALGLKLFF